MFNKARLKQLLACTSIVAACFLAPMATHATTADDDYVKSAESYYAAGDLPAAIVELKNALQANPGNPAARSLLGRLYFERGDYVGAEKELSRAWDLGLRTEEVQLLLARARLGLGDFTAAIEGTEVTPDLDAPLTQDLLVVRGEALLGVGQTEDAAKAFQAVLSVTPHAGAYAGLARIALMNGRVDESLAFANKALEADPQDAALHALIGNIHAFAGRTAEASAAMSRALEIDPKNLDALVGMTRLKLAAKDYASAKEFVDWALGVGGDRSNVVVLKGYVELALQNYSIARMVADTVLAGDSGNLTALYVGGVAAFGLDETEQARSRLTQYLSRSPGDLHAKAVLDYLKGQTQASEEARNTLLSLISTQALAQGNAQTGERALEYLTAQASDSSRLRAQLSIAKSNAGDLLRAEEELSQAIRLDKDGQFAGEVDQAATALILAQIRKRDFEKAIQLASALADRRPDQATPYTLLAITYAEQGDSAKALEAVQTASTKNPDAPELMGNYAALQARLGNIDGALETLKETIAKHEGHYRTLLQLAALSFQGQDPDQAILWADKALLVEPKAVEPRIILARSYNVQKRYDKALEITQDAVAQNAGNVALLDVVGEAQLNLGHTADAVKTYQAMVDAAPYSGAAYFYLARAYLENKQNDLVGPTLQKALAIEPEHYPARMAYARFVLAKGDTEQAAPLVESLARQYSGNPEVHELSGQFALAKGDYAGAIAQLTEAQNAYAKGGVYRRSITEALAKALWRQGDKERAVAEMESWLSRYPDDVAMRLQVAEAQSQSGRVDAAAEQYAQVIAMQPSNWLARNDLAMLLYNKGAYAEARTHAELAYQAAGDNPAVMDTLGIILLADKQLGQALPLLEKANAAVPDHPEIALHLSEAYEQSGRKLEARNVLERVLSKPGEFQGRDAVEERYRELAE